MKLSIVTLAMFLAGCGKGMNDYEIMRAMDECEARGMKPEIHTLWVVYKVECK